MLMNRFSAGERFQEVLPEDDVLRAKLGYVGLLGIHQLQQKDAKRSQDHSMVLKRNWMQLEFAEFEPS